MSAFDPNRRLNSMARICAAFQSNSASVRWPICRAGSGTVSCSTSITTVMAQSFSSTPARSAAKGSCQSGSARPTAPADQHIGSRSKTRKRRQCAARPKKIGAVEFCPNAGLLKNNTPACRARSHRPGARLYLFRVGGKAMTRDEARRNRG
jgi:hypothetical protein